MSLASFADQIIKLSVNAYRAGRGRRRHPGSAEYWRQLPDKVLSEARCAFVLSTGRCGTQLLTRVLNRCGNVDVNHHAELTSELQFPARRAYETGLQGGLGLEMAALSCRYEPIQTSYLNERAYVETNNRITFFAPSLANVFKSARFLHLVRNPVSFVRSGVNAGFYSGGYYDTGRIEPTRDPAKANWREYSQVRKVAWLWNATNQFAEDFKSRLDPNRVMTVRSEDFFKDADVVTEVIDFLGGNAIPDRTMKRLRTKPVNSGPPGGLPKSWDDWAAKDQLDVRHECLLAESYGYSINLRAASHPLRKENIPDGGIPTNVETGPPQPMINGLR